MPDTDDADRALILKWFRDFRESAPEEFGRYIIHCGISLEDAIAAHYQRPDGTYDVERAAMDMATYPPVAAKIAIIATQRALKAGQDG